MRERRARRLKDLLTELSCPECWRANGIVISELVRCAIAPSQGRHVGSAGSDAWTDDDIAQMQKTWERQKFAEPMVRALEGERIFAQSSYDLMRKSNRETVGILYGLEEFMVKIGRVGNSRERFARRPSGCGFFLRRPYIADYGGSLVGPDQLRYCGISRGLSP